MFNKQTYEGHWFNDDETNADYTEKTPPSTAYVWDEIKNEWVLQEYENGSY